MSVPFRHDRTEPIADVLARIRIELEEISRRIDQNQALIAKATWNANAADHHYVAAMQDADLSAQRVAGVAEFLHAIADASRPDWRVDAGPATAAIKLTELARSIGAPAGSVERRDEPASGNVDLF